MALSVTTPLMLQLSTDLLPWNIPVLRLVPPDSLVFLRGQRLTLSSSLQREGFCCAECQHLIHQIPPGSCVSTAVMDHSLIIPLCSHEGCLGLFLSQFSWRHIWLGWCWSPRKHGLWSEQLILHIFKNFLKSFFFF